MKTGYIILGHGSRAKEANESLKLTTNIIKDKLASDFVIAAYLGFAEPNLEQAVAELVNKECREIIIVPFFLYNGIHLQEDVPAKIAKLEDEYGAQVSFKCTNHLGEDGRLADIVFERIKEVN